MTPRQQALRARLLVKREKRRRRLIRKSGYDPDFIDGLARFYRTTEGLEAVAALNAAVASAHHAVVDNGDGTFSHEFRFDRPTITVAAP